jgi:hypothetical protein
MLQACYTVAPTPSTSGPQGVDRRAGGAMPRASQPMFQSFKLQIFEHDFKNLDMKSVDEISLYNICKG